jgi:hypothetical protein
VTLSVTHGGKTVTATQVKPEKPAVTGPASGNYNAANPINVTWTAAITEPDQIEVFADGAYTVSGNDYDETLTGAAASQDIPAGTHKATTNGIFIEVRFVETVTAFSGSAVSRPTIEVEHTNYVTINTN